MELGKVISTPDSPSTRKFCFTLNRDARVRRGQFVQLNLPEGKLIGRVSDLRKTNRYFTNPENLAEPELYPTWEWEFLVADVTPLGFWTQEGLQGSLFPPSPGEPVLEPDPEILQKLFGFVQDGLWLGQLLHHPVEARFNLTRLLQKHLAILALSGAGKSYLVSVLIEELLERRLKPAVIVIDPHGEYVSFSQDPNYAGKTRVWRIEDIKLKLNPILKKAEMLFDLTPSQARVLEKLVQKELTPSELLQLIEEWEGRQETKDALLGMAERLIRLGIFGLRDQPEIREIAREGQLSVIDLSGTIDWFKKQLVVEHFASKLFSARREGLIPPFLLVIEEAHQFVPEGTKRKEALAKGILQTIAREGRKFSASLCLVSQRPKRLDTTILSQCNTNIILRITNPYDIKHIAESAEGITSDVQEQIAGLPVGHALVIGEAVNQPVFIKVRKRKSRESEKGRTLEESLREWEERKRQKVEDAKAFM